MSLFESFVYVYNFKIIFYFYGKCPWNSDRDLIESVNHLECMSILTILIFSISIVQYTRRTVYFIIQSIRNRNSFNPLWKLGFELPSITM